MRHPVIETMPLGFQWQTVDPFLFCVHHLDHYPVGNDRLGPAASLAGRQLGRDFDGIDGWRMYHGIDVPGFPQHPHRGFETITFVRRGLIDHSDSLGAAARFGRGDVQWITAGSGIVHAEMFPLVEPHEPNTLELFQIWMNLAAVDKMAEPHFAMLWDHDIPRQVVTGTGGRTAEITVIAGELDGQIPPPPPPHSWAARGDTDVAIWHARFDPDARWTMPPARTADTVRTLYVFEGAGLTVDGHELGTSTGAVVTADARVELVARAGAVELLVLQGRPIGEPIAQYGPFVMNTRAEIAEAFDDYQRTQFGGWPWQTDGPTHGAAPTRFARHADGRVEEVVPA